MVSREKITIDGVHTRVVSSGQGRSLVLIHGLGGPQMWERVAEPLASQFSVVSFELPGFDEDSFPGRSFSTDKYARFISRGIEKLELNDVILCGISYGGQIAIVVAASYPERISRIVLIAPTGIASPAWFAQSNFTWGIIESLLRHTALRSRTILDFASKRSFYDIANRPDDFIDRFRRQLKRNNGGTTYLHCLRNALACDVDVRRILRELHAPTLLMWGENDKVVPVAMASEFQTILRSSKVIIIPKCGHSLPLEKPDELCSSIIQFQGS